MEQAAINELVRGYYVEHLFAGDKAQFDAVMEKLSVCELVGLDFDGTITFRDWVIVREDGREHILRSRRDSLLISAVTKKAGVRFAVISTEENPVVKANCTKIKIECFQSVQDGEDKLVIFQRKSGELGIPQDRTVFMGNDINDIPCLKWAGIAFCPSDSHFVVKAVVKERGGIVLLAEGGNGALRLLTELVLLAKGKDIKR